MRLITTAVEMLARFCRHVVFQTTRHGAREDSDDDVVLCAAATHLITQQWLHHRHRMGVQGVQGGSNGELNVPRTSVSKGTRS